MTNKKTVKEFFNEIKAIVEEYGTTEQVEFLNKRIELIDKKTENKKATVLQVENEKIKEVIMEILTNLDNAISIDDLQKTDENLANYSNQKISALLTQLKKNGLIKRTEVKGKAYFEAVK